MGSKLRHGTMRCLCLLIYACPPLFGCPQPCSMSHCHAATHTNVVSVLLCRPLAFHASTAHGTSGAEGLGTYTTTAAAFTTQPAPAPYAPHVLNAPVQTYSPHTRVVPCRMLAQRRTFHPTHWEAHCGAGSAKKWKASIKIEPGGGAPEVPGTAPPLPIGRYFDLRGVEFKPARTLGACLQGGGRYVGCCEVICVLHSTALCSGGGACALGSQL